jgi:hypothetical protein
VRRRHPRTCRYYKYLLNLNVALELGSNLNSAAPRGPTPKWQGTFSTLPLKITIPPRDPTLDGPVTSGRRA